MQIPSSAMNSFLPGASVGLCWSPLVYASNAPSSGLEHQNCMCVCVCACVFKCISIVKPPPASRQNFQINVECANGTVTCDVSQ